MNLKTILSFSTSYSRLYVFHISTKLYTVSWKLANWYSTFTLDITLALNSVTTQWVPLLLFLLCLLKTIVIVSYLKIQLPRRLTLTSRPALPGIPIIYHRTGILTIVGVNLRIKLLVNWNNPESLLHVTTILVKSSNSPQ